MKTFKTTLFLALLFMATTAFGQKTIEKTFSGVEDIRLSVASGSIVVKKASGSDVKVTLEYNYDDDDYEAEFDQSGSRLRMGEEFKNRRNWNNRGRSEWTLEIPDGMSLDMNTGSGNIEVLNVEADILASSGSGRVEVEGIKGYSRLTTGSGSISAEDMEGELKVNTGSGAIRVRDINGDSDLNTGSGSIRVNNATGGMQYNTGSGSIDAINVSITDHSRFNTGSGSIDVVLSAALDSDVSLNTGSGSATLDFNGQTIEGKFTLEASGKNNISAPFKFDKEYEEEGGRGWRGRDKRYIKEAEIGSKNIHIDISTGSGSARVKK